MDASVILSSNGLFRPIDMSEWSRADPSGENPPRSRSPSDTHADRAHLERAHYELCTALTILQSNVDLMRLELLDRVDREARLAVHGHVAELESAIDRLQLLAREIREWRARGRRFPTLTANVRVIPRSVWAQECLT